MVIDGGITTAKLINVGDILLCRVQALLGKERGGRLD